MKSKVLIIGNRPDFASVLTPAGYGCDTVPTAAAAMARLGSGEFQGVVIELDLLNKGDGGLVEEMHRLSPGLCILAVATNPAAADVLSALRAGAFDCMLDPVSDAEIVRTLERGLENRRIFAELTQKAAALESRNGQLETQRDEYIRGTRDLIAISEIARAMTSSLDLEETLRIIIDGIQRVLRFDRVVLSLVNNDRRVIEAKISSGSAEEAFCRQSWSLDDPALGQISAVLDGGQTVIVDPGSGGRAFPDGFTALYPSAFAIVPMIAKDSVIGAVTADNSRSGAPITPEDVQMLEIFCEHAGIAIENARLYYDILKSREAVVHAQKQLVEAEKLAALGAMAASINHEINNPLCAILLDTQLLLLKLTPEDEVIRKRVLSIEQNVKRIKDVTEKVSAVKRTIVTSYHPKASMIDLNLSSR